MLDSVTAESVFAEIMMDEPFPNAFLLVEGPDENAVFFGHIPPDVHLIICGGKRNVLGAVTLAQSGDYDRVYGLVDSDFDRLRGLDAFYPAHVVATEAYDLIADLALSAPDVLRRSLSAHAPTGVRVVEDVTGDAVDQSVFALTSMLAGARLAALREGYPLVFKGYDFMPVIRETYEPADIGSFVANAACRTPPFEIDARVLAAVSSAFAEVGTSRNHSGGHDIVSASVALLRKAGSQTSARSISGTLIAVASCRALASLACIQALTALARTDSGVELLECAAA